MNFPKVNRNRPSTFNTLIAKQTLYGELLKLPVEDLSESDISLMYLLANDPEIQAFLTNKLGV